jgi:hypothetical protein
LGIRPNFALCKYYFCATVFLKSVRRGELVPVRIGSRAIQIRQSRADEYITMKGSSSNKGWHQRWIYLRSDDDAPLPPYTGRFFGEAPERWSYGPVAPEKRRIDSLFQAVKRLVDAGMTGAGVIAAGSKPSRRSS